VLRATAAGFARGSAAAVGGGSAGGGGAGDFSAVAALDGAVFATGIVCTRACGDAVRGASAGALAAGADAAAGEVAPRLLAAALVK